MNGGVHPDAGRQQAMVILNEPSERSGNCGKEIDMWTRRSVFGLALALVLAVGSGWATEAAAHPNESKLSKITKAKELRAGWAAYKPFAYRDNDGKLTGFAIEYIETMAAALGVEVKWVEDQWATLVAGLVADKYAVTVNANRTWSRILVAEFTEPIAVTKKGLLIRTEDRDKIRTPADLRNSKLRIASTLGDAASEAMARLYPKPQKIAFPNFADFPSGARDGKGRRHRRGYRSHREGRQRARGPVCPARRHLVRQRSGALCQARRPGMAELGELVHSGVEAGRDGR